MFKPLLGRITSTETQIVNQIAYLTVTVSLVQAVAESPLRQPFVEMTLGDADFRPSLEAVIAIALNEGEAWTLEQTASVRFEKVLYFFCAVQDLQQAADQWLVFQDTPMLKHVAQCLVVALRSDGISAQTAVKQCFATLTRESKRKGGLATTSALLREAYEA